MLTTPFCTTPVQGCPTLVVTLPSPLPNPSQPHAVRGFESYVMPHSGVGAHSVDGSWVFPSASQGTPSLHPASVEPPRRPRPHSRPRLGSQPSPGSGEPQATPLEAAKALLGRHPAPQRAPRARPAIPSLRLNLSGRDGGRISADALAAAKAPGVGNQPVALPAKHANPHAGPHLLVIDPRESATGLLPHGLSGPPVPSTGLESPP